MPADTPIHTDDLEQLEIEALREAVAEADAQFETGECIDHEGVRDWLLDLARGVARTPPDPATQRRS